MTDDPPDDPRFAYSGDYDDVRMTDPPPPPPPAPGSVEERDAFIGTLSAEDQVAAKAFVAEREKALQQKIAAMSPFAPRPKPPSRPETLYGKK